MGEQHGGSTGFGSISSARVRFGSYRFSCHLPSRPIFGFSVHGYAPLLQPLIGGLYVGNAQRQVVHNAADVVRWGVAG